MAHPPGDAQSINSDLPSPKPKVVLGRRVYSALGWTRKDQIWFMGQRIGQITLSHNDRPGTTIALNGRRHPGRAVAWCTHQFITAEIKKHQHSFRLAA